MISFLLHYADAKVDFTCIVSQLFHRIAYVAEKNLDYVRQKLWNKHSSVAFVS